MSAATLLDRLERVRQTGPGRWFARCPGHEDRSPSLSIRELDDGRVLLHDFGGCETGDVLAALGLTMSDLFAKPLGAFELTHSRVPAADRLEMISFEVSVAYLLLDQVRASGGTILNQLGMERLGEALQRINAARDYGAR